MRSDQGGNAGKTHRGADRAAEGTGDEARGRPYEDTGVVAGDVAIESKGVEHPDDHDDDKPGLGVLVGGVSTTVVGLAVKKRTLW